MSYPKDFTLVLKVTFNPNNQSNDRLAGLLLDVANQAYDNGLFTGDTDAEVIDWSAEVILEPDTETGLKE